MEVEGSGREGPPRPPRPFRQIHNFPPSSSLSSPPPPIHHSQFSYTYITFWTHHQVGCVGGCTANHFATNSNKKGLSDSRPCLRNVGTFSCMFHTDIDPFPLIIVGLHPGPWFLSSNHFNTLETQWLHINLHFDSARDHSGSFNRAMVEIEEP